MIGGDQTIPGAGPKGEGEGFPAGKDFELLDPEGTARANPVNESTASVTFDVKRVMERKALDEKQIKDAFATLEDLTSSPPGWRDIYEAQKKRKASEEAMLGKVVTELNPERVRRRNAIDEEQILKAIQMFDDVGFRPNWRDIYEAQKNRKSGEEASMEVIDPIPSMKARALQDVAQAPSVIEGKAGQVTSTPVLPTPTSTQK